MSSTPSPLTGLRSPHVLPDFFSFVVSTRLPQTPLTVVSTILRWFLRFRVLPTPPPGLREKPPPSLPPHRPFFGNPGDVESEEGAWTFSLIRGLGDKRGVVGGGRYGGDGPSPGPSFEWRSRPREPGSGSGSSETPLGGWTRRRPAVSEPSQRSR